MKLENVNIETLNGGEVSELLELGLRDVLMNIDDPNSKAAAPRKLVLTVTMKPSDDRSTAVVTADVKFTPAPRATGGSYVYLEKSDSGEREMKAKAAEKDLFEQLEEIAGGNEAPTPLRSVNAK